LRRAGAVLAGVALAWAGLHAAVDRPSVERRLRVRIAEALASRLGPVDLGPELRVDWLFRVTFGPVATRPSRPGAAPAVHVQWVKVRPSLTALLAGRVEPASIGLSGVRIDPRGEAGGGRERSPSAAAATRDRGDESIPTVHFRDVVVALPWDGGTVDLGPIRGTATFEREGDELVVRADVRAPGGASAIVTVRRGAELRLDATVEEVGPETLPEAWRGRAVRLAGGALSAAVVAKAPRDLSRIEGHVSALAEGVVLAGARLAPAPVGPMRLEADGDVALDLRARRATLRGGEVRLLDAVQVAVEGEAALGLAPTFSVSLRADDLDYAAAVAALPAALAPGPDAPRPAGTFSARLEASGPPGDPGGWTVAATLDLTRLREAARREAPVALRGPFTYRPRGEHGPEPAIRIGPENPDFVPLADLPVHLVRAVTTSEDAGFFGHAGFDFDELRNAVAEGAEAGRVVRGGSTITQQLAKNLYLSPERTLARKVREAFVTIALEATVPKARLLEIYLNVVEWGPGIRGIGPAARHWFGKDARELTPREAAFLASVIPSPVRYHAMYARGAPSPAWEDRVNALLLKMSEQGVLTEDELLEALEEPIVFAGG
jgi:hypothetical protein